MSPSRPNLIFILADDIGYADLGCTGARDSYNRKADVSPNLDKLAANGIRFTRSYSNSAVCSPTRFALATGRWQYRLRGAAEEPLPATGNGDKVLGLPPEHPTIASLLRNAGYATALVGKWHLGHPPHFGPRKSGYDEFYGFHAGGSDYFAHCNPLGQPDFWSNEAPIQDEGYMTDLLSRQACEFVQRQSADKPFLLSLHYSAPHWPWLTRDDEAESKRIAGIGKHLDGGSVDTYQKMIHHMDEGIGWLVQTLQERGMLENTLIVFSSDNGGERFSNNWPFTGQKMDLMEGGIRVPTIAHWPAQFQGGLECPLPHLTMDWTATFLDVGNATPNADYPLDGRSLLPYLTPSTNVAHAQWPEERDLFWRMKHREQRALIRGDWKYLSMEGTDYLFNIANDSRERATMVNREPAKLAALKQAWLDINATLPPVPEAAKVSLVFTKKDLPQATF